MTFRTKFLATLVMLTVSMQLVTVGAAQTKSKPVTTVTHVDIIPMHTGHSQRRRSQTCSQAGVSDAA